MGIRCGGAAAIVGLRAVSRCCLCAPRCPAAAAAAVAVLRTGQAWRAAQGLGLSDQCSNTGLHLQQLPVNGHSAAGEGHT